MSLSESTHQNAAYCLTIPQKNIWNMHKMYQGKSITNICCSVIFDELMEKHRMLSAMEQTIHSHTVFQICFVEQNGQMKQRIDPNMVPAIEQKKFRNVKEMNEYADSMAKLPMDPIHNSLARIVYVEVEERKGWIFCINHLITDAWGLALLLNDFIHRYHNKKEKKDNSVRDNLKYVVSERQYLESSQYEKDAHFWENNFTKEPELSQIKYYQKKTNEIASKRYVFNISQYFSNIISTFCRKYRISLPLFFKGIVIAYLSRVNYEQEEIIIGIPVLNRSKREEKQTCGMYVTTSPVKIKVEKQDSFELFLSNLNECLMDTYRHHKYPFDTLLSNLRSKYGGLESLFDIVVSYQHATIDAECDIEWYSNGYCFTPLEIHIDERKQYFTLTFEYQSDLFSELDVCLLAERLVFLMEQVIENPGITLNKLELLPESERKLLDSFQGIKAPLTSNESCFQTLMQSVIKKKAEKAALVTSKKRYTFMEINQMSDSLAKTLIKKGVKKNSIVPIIAKRSFEVVIGMLSVIKAGGAFFVIDASYPDNRIEYLLKECNATIILTCHASYNGAISLENYNYEVINDMILPQSSGDDLIYATHTSGSTGLPKIAVVTHGNLINWIKQCHVLHENTSYMISFTTVSFDIFISETLVPLCYGQTVVFPDEETTTNPTRFKKEIQKYPNCILFQTPTRLSYLIDYDSDLQFLDNVSCVVSGGEKFSPELYEKILEINPRCRIFNGYGPCETAIGCSLNEIKGHNFSIGHPINNTDIFILDNYQRLLPIGVMGEIAIAGDSVGKGYWNRKELTEEKFVNCLDLSDAKMYLSGDLGYFRTDGFLEFVERKDFQIKLHGLRIETGEIESVIQQFQGISKSVVCVKESQNQTFFIGYYTVECENIDEMKLKQYLLSKLPRYMVPDHYIKVDRFKTTSSGKVDRKNLPLPDLSQKQMLYKKPENEIQRKLCTLMGQILGVTKFGILDDFFECGCDSLKAIEFASRAYDIGFSVKVQDLFEHPNIETLCASIKMELSAAESEMVLTDIQSVEQNKSNYFSNIDSNNERISIQKNTVYNDLLCNNNLEQELRIDNAYSISDVFLTGAGGFLGCHILDVLLRETNSNIYCLVRDHGEKLEQSVSYYFGIEYWEKHCDRIKIVTGDIINFSKSNIKNISIVIHAAANVKHYGKYEASFLTNVEGTRNILAFAMQQHARYLHISTTSVGGLFLNHSIGKQFVFDESCYDVDQNLDNIYIRSKYEAERIVFDAILAGEDCKIIRVGNLTNRHKDYKFQQNYKENSFYQRLSFMKSNHKWPIEWNDMIFDFSPVDDVANAIFYIAKFSVNNQFLFHVFNPEKFTYADLIETGFPDKDIELISADLMRNEIKNSANKQAYILSAEMDEIARAYQHTFVIPDCERSVMFLKKCGFTWKKIDKTYLNGYADYFMWI